MRLNLAYTTIATNVLGPGVRRILWVQGCPRRCPECITPEMLPFEDRDWVEVEELADRFLPDQVEGVTFVGGEPFSQAAALAELVDLIRKQRPWSVVTYSGYTLGDLQQGSKDWQTLLRRTDLLIDGEYLADRACDLLWRGSDNQKLHFLSNRYRHLEPLRNHRGRHLEFQIGDNNRLVIVGIPSRDFERNFTEAAHQKGVEVS